MTEVALYTLNVGHGLCQVLMLPKRHAILVDGGPRANKHVAEDFLERNVDVLVAYIATHNDSDHVGAAPYLLARYESSRTLHQIWMLIDRPGGEIPLLEYARARRDDGSIGELIYANLGDERHRKPRRIYRDRSSGCEVSLLYPGMWQNADAFHRAAASPQAQNRTSIVIRIVRGQATALVTGDADLESFRIIQQDFRFSVQTQVLSIPHHGGRSPGSVRRWTVQDFCTAARPRFAVVSTGTGRTIRAESLRPFVAAGAHVCCTQLTRGCHTEPARFGRGLSITGHVASAPRPASGVDCGGSICAVLSPEGAQIHQAANHRAAVARHVRPDGTPLCL